MIKFLVYIIFLFSFSSVFSNTIEVGESSKIKSIKAAISVANAGDTILVKKGVYKEFNIYIDKPLVIIGEGQPIIDGEKKGGIIFITSDNVVFDGFTLQNVGRSYVEDYAAIRVRNCKNFTIKNLILKQLFFGIYIEKSQDGTLYNNTIAGDAVDEYNSGNGIQLWYSNNIHVEENKVSGVRDGIYLEFSHFCMIKNNISNNNIRYGLHFMFSNDDLYQHNLFENNGAGVAVMFSKRIKMTDNIFRENWGSAAYGVLLKEINDVEIINNVFEKNTVAINVEGSNRILYKNNDFIHNGWAIKVRGACYKNEFTSNNFLHNSFDVSYNSRINDNYFDGNYWSEYTGYDLDKDGIGDVPYRPVKLFSYIVNRVPETIVLLRSLFIDLIDFSEKVSPVFTPDDLMDNRPLMKKIQ